MPQQILQDADTTGVSQAARLNRHDMLTYESRLQQAVARLVPHKSHSMYFPRKGAGSAARWLPEEDKLLLPLCNREGAVLGVFVARGIASAHRAEQCRDLWDSLCDLVLENISLYKQSQCDPLTGLYTRHALLQAMEHELLLLQAGMHSGGSNKMLVELPDASRRASMGIIVVRFSALRDVVREFGYAFADELTKALAEQLRQQTPGQRLAACLGDTEFAVFVPGARTKQCRALARDIAAAMRSVCVVHPLRKEKVCVTASVGYAVYPQDMEGALAGRPAGEQVRLILRKARLAAALAQEDDRADASQAVMGFAQILQEGGRIQEVLPMSRIIVSLGSGMHAREGQRFSVWDASTPSGGPAGQSTLVTPLYKGEIVLMDVQENASQAEIIHLADPTWNLEPGDKLVFVPEEQGAGAKREGTALQRDPHTGLLRHGDFFARWAEEREKCRRFSLALIRLAPLSLPAEAGEDQEQSLLQINQRLIEGMLLCRDELGGSLSGGRYGLNSLIFFHPESTAEDAASAYKNLAALLEQRLDLQLAAGIAPYPYLEYRKADTAENCKKALEYALLLPAPHVGIIDTLALNISADKLFSQGNTFAAIKEYQHALTADSANSLAWNSLGVCFARLGKAGEAEQHFLRALEHDPSDVMALYNLGHIYQAQNQEQQAATNYRRCLELDPEYLFAYIRLGQLAEIKKDYVEAKRLFGKAASLPGGLSLTCRHFARISIAEGKIDEAREYLHEALEADPYDAFAMQLFAKLYLDGGEDPEMALSFARQSVSLRPELRAGWLELARALDLLGRPDQAKEARLRAGRS